MLSEKSSTSSSTERRNRQEKCQKPPPPRAGGANLSYENTLYPLLEHTNNSKMVNNVCYGTCVANTDPPTLNSVTSSDMDDVKNAYPNTFKELGDPNEILAMKTQTSTCTVYGRDHVTVKHSLREGNNPKDYRQMNDSH